MGHLQKCGEVCPRIIFTNENFEFSEQCLEITQDRVKKAKEATDKLIAQLTMELYSLPETSKKYLNKNTELLNQNDSLNAV